jgi:hypothetical protein
MRQPRTVLLFTILHLEDMGYKLPALIENGVNSLWILRKV